MAVTSVASTTADQQALPSRNRLGLTFVNTDANAVYVLLDSSVSSATNYSFKLDQDEDAIVPNYDGEVRVIWAGNGSGVLLVTEW